MVGLLSLIVWLQNVCNSVNDEAYRILLLIPSTVVFKDEILLEFLVTLVLTAFKDDSILDIESEIDEIFLVFVLTDACKDDKLLYKYNSASLNVYDFVPNTTFILF